MRAGRARPRVGILMGSDSDWPLVGKAGETLSGLGVSFEAHVMSAHRTPERVVAYVTEAPARGLKVLLAAAGGAAHLAGTVAAHTTLPVIGIPIEGGAFHGMDALLATAQMPAGVPVATVGVGSAGPVNAALLAAQILALSDADLAKRLQRHKQGLKDKVAEADRRVQGLAAHGT